MCLHCNISKECVESTLFRMCKKIKPAHECVNICMCVCVTPLSGPNEMHAILPSNVWYFWINELGVSHLLSNISQIYCLNKYFILPSFSSNNLKLIKTYAYIYWRTNLVYIERLHKKSIVSRVNRPHFEWFR